MRKDFLEKKDLMTVINSYKLKIVINIIIVI